jgi:LacI family transcriptional regulator
LRVIQAQACAGIQVADVAREAGWSRSLLEKRFRARLGRSVHAEISRVRLRRVAEWLARTDLPLKVIADRAGYGTVQYMSNVFRKWSGLTPGQFRKREVGTER